MGTLAHIFEAQGLSTVAISLVRAHIEKAKAPRALHCEFPMGRPLGKPGDAAFQRKVLDAAFKTLEATAGPVLADFPETIKDAADQPLSCPLPPRSDDSLAAEVDEALGLRPAYDRARKAHNGRTNVGRIVDADGIPGIIESFIKIRDGVNNNEAGIPTKNLMEAAKDIMSYYEEAASELADHVPAARAAESWFFQKTSTGKMLKEARQKLHEDKVPVWFYLTPFTQPD